MTTYIEGHVRVGHVQIPLAMAADWVRDYTDVEKNITSTAPYAYPAYDGYCEEANEPQRLTDGDLLAPVLLNVRLSVRSFYGLQRSRGALEEALASEDLARPLADVEDPERVAAMVRPLYALLDDPATKPWGVGGTTLSKVLHRKRPHSVVLHDKWVRACYVSESGPVPPARTRTYANYMALVTQAIAEDIRCQQTQFDLLDDATGQPGKLSRVRVADILAWRSQGNAPADEVEVSNPDWQ